jgi:Family of unknown function (DUF6399)
LVGRGKKSLRQLAPRVNRSKSSVHRHIKAQARRNQHPESALWETEAGEAWLKLLIVSTLLTFGMECHVGVDKLTKFFKQIRIDTHVGVSPSALGHQLNRMENLLPLFQKLCENCASALLRPAIVAMDETFFGKCIILVLMDLSSGYLILEDISHDRRFDTWFEKAIPRLEALGLDVNHAVSDRAKALIKLAVTGFDCQSGADLFHAQQDVSKWLGATLGRRHEKAKIQLETAEEMSQKNLNSLPELVQLVDAENAYKQIQEVKADYHENLAGISDEVHPYSLQTQQPNRTEQVIAGLEQRAQAFEKIALSQTIADLKSTMNKFRNQFNDLAANVEAWWLWVMEILVGLSVDEATQYWLIHTLLPTVYWYQQQHKTQNPNQREKYHQAWQRAAKALQADAFTATLPENELQRWLEWAEWMARQFHRSSSAVEGRNGYLSQMYHNGRGFTEKRLRALTVIHNYGLKRADGTTAAMRLFGQTFPDLFSWLVDEMGALPLPRKGRERATRNPLFLKTVPA